MTPQELNQELGNIDLYLLDHLLKGRFSKNMKILDAGCGEGRNLVYFIRNGFDVYGVDKNPDAIKMLHYQVKSLNPQIEKERFFEGDLSKLLLPPGYFDVVICSAVLHFAQDHEHFLQMWSELMRVTKAGGLLFCRMTSNIGMSQDIFMDRNGRADLPDGSQRYLLTQSMLDELVGKFQLKMEEPVKTVNVQDLRCMTTLLLRKI
jgi:tellurite methyltransferase